MLPVKNDSPTLGRIAKWFITRVIPLGCLLNNHTTAHYN